MTDREAKLEALAMRLQGAADRLKAAAGPSPGELADRYAPGEHELASPPRNPAVRGPDCTDSGPPGEGMSAVLARLEAAGAAVRDARHQLAELQQRLDSH